MSSEDIDNILDGIPMEALESNKAVPATKAAVVEKTKKEKKPRVVREKKSCAFTLPEQCFALLLNDNWREARKIALKWKREMETYKSQYERWITK